jgi:hypothetical protein
VLGEEIILCVWLVAVEIERALALLLHGRGVFGRGFLGWHDGGAVIAEMGMKEIR